MKEVATITDADRSSDPRKANVVAMRPFWHYFDEKDEHGELVTKVVTLTHVWIVTLSDSSSSQRGTKRPLDP